MVQTNGIANGHAPVSFDLPKKLPPFEKEPYEYKECLPNYPVIDYPPHEPFEHVDRGLNADPEKKALLSACTKVKHMTPYIGTEIEGIDLASLSDKQKDELTLLGAERGVLVFRNQRATIYDLIKNASYYGPVHVHSTTGVPSDPALNGVHLVWNDGSKPSEWSGNRGVGWHSDQTYEENCMGFTALKVVTAPSSGGDTIWSNAQALLSTFSPSFITYLEGLSALHSSDHQKQRAENNGTYIRRPQTDYIHPVVRVHPVTGIKGLYVNPSYTRRIVGMPEHESDAILSMIYRRIEASPDMQVRVSWEKDTVVMWDNRVTWHTAIGDYFPERRHGLRATPRAEIPISVEKYERGTGKKAKDWYNERMKGFGVDVSVERLGGGQKKTNGAAPLKAGD